MNTKLNFVDYVEFMVQNPTQLTERGYPTDICSVYVFVNRSWNEMNNDHHKPQSQQVDDAIVFITDNRDEADRLKNGKGGFLRWVCANCGCGLHLTACPGCGATFRDDAFRMGASMPMPRKVVDFLQAKGHVFGQDPEIVWAKER